MSPFAANPLSALAFAAVVALSAVEAWVALAAESAAAADGTFPRLDSRMSAPVSESFLTLAAVIALAPIFVFVAEPFLIFAAVTAFFFNCFVPTLFFGSAVAAYVVPPSAMKSANKPITFPRKKRRNPLLMCPVLSM